eukprot:gene8409-5669_t
MPVFPAVQRPPAPKSGTEGVTVLPAKKDLPSVRIFRPVGNDVFLIPSCTPSEDGSSLPSYVTAGDGASFAASDKNAPSASPESRILSPQAIDAYTVFIDKPSPDQIHLIGFNLLGNRITDVLPGSPASSAGLLPDLLIQSVGQRDIFGTDADMERRIWDFIAESSDPIAVQVRTLLKPQSAAAIVSCSANSLAARSPVRAWGFRLPPGYSAQHAEALNGWLQLKFARRSRYLVVWAIFDSEVVVALIVAAYGDPLAALYREMAPWVWPYREILEGWQGTVWIVRQT